jgi:hypothetical protein
LKTTTSKACPRKVGAYQVDRCTVESRVVARKSERSGVDVGGHDAVAGAGRRDGDEAGARADLEKPTRGLCPYRVEEQEGVVRWLVDVGVEAVTEPGGLEFIHDRAPRPRVN